MSSGELKWNRAENRLIGGLWLPMLVVLIFFSGCRWSSQPAVEVAYPHKPENYQDAVLRLNEIHQLLVAEDGVPDPRIFQATCEHSAGGWPSHRQEYAEVIDGKVLIEGGPTLEISISREWADLVRWLPYLAADSNLSKQSWDQIHSLSGQLLPMIGQIIDSDEQIFQRNYRSRADQLQCIYLELTGMLDLFDQTNRQHPF
jgi:hypothetical protein